MTKEGAAGPTLQWYSAQPAEGAIFHFLSILHLEEIYFLSTLALRPLKGLGTHSNSSKLHVSGMRSDVVPGLFSASLQSLQLCLVPSICFYGCLLN